MQASELSQWNPWQAFKEHIDLREPMPIRVVFKRTSRKRRQALLASNAKRLGMRIRDLKRFYGNGSSLLIPNATISASSNFPGKIVGCGDGLEFAVRFREVPKQ